MMRIPIKGKSRKPLKFKNTSETFEFKSAVLAYYDTHSMPALVAAFWPGIEPRNRAYATKKQVVLRWRQSCSRIDALVASAKTAKLKRYRELSSAKTLSDDVELDIFEWLVAVRRIGMLVSATMLQQVALEIASAMYRQARSQPHQRGWLPTSRARAWLSEQNLVRISHPLQIPLRWRRSLPQRCAAV
jgi:hypothetical protein